MANNLLSRFYEETQQLSLVSSIRTDGSYTEFMASVGSAFERAKSPELQRLLIEAFLRPIAGNNGSASDSGLSDFSRVYFAACLPATIERIKAYFASVPHGDPVGSRVKQQFEHYQAELLLAEQREREAKEKLRAESEQRDNERRKREREEQERQAALQRERKMQEEEEERRKKAERERQMAEQAAKNRRAVALKKALVWGAVALAAAPVAIAGLTYITAWWSESNYAAVLFYVLFAIVAGRIYRGIIAIDGFQTELRNFWAAWLTAGLMIMITYLSWSSVPNIVKALLVAGAVGFPFTAYARGALGSVAIGIIAALVFYFSARLCSAVVMAFLGWVLPEGSISKPTMQTSSSALAGVGAIRSFTVPSRGTEAVQGASYTARISPRDLRNSKGVYLPHVSGVKPRDILLQERFNYHDGVNRDYEDTADSIYSSGERTRLRKVFESRQVRVQGGGDAMTLLESNPVLSVTITSDEILISPVQ